MKKTVKLILISIFSLYSVMLYANDRHFIIYINEYVNRRVDVEILALDSNSVEFSIKPIYFPGKLTIRDEDYAKLSNSLDNIKIIIFEHYCKKGRYYTKKYEINAYLDWLKYNFCFLHIYDLKLSKYKRLFRKDRNVQYVCEIEYPGGGANSIYRKRYSKEEKQRCRD